MPSTPRFINRVCETLRGHSSIGAALDLALLIEREAQLNQLNPSPFHCAGTQRPDELIDQVFGVL